MKDFDEFDEDFNEDEVKVPSEHEVAMRKVGWQIYAWFITNLTTAEKAESLSKFYSQKTGIYSMTAMSSVVLFLISFIFFQVRAFGESKYHEFLNSQDPIAFLNQHNVVPYDLSNTLAMFLSFSDDQILDMFNNIETFDLILRINLERIYGTTTSQLAFASVTFYVDENGALQRSFSATDIWQTDLKVPRNLDESSFIRYIEQVLSLSNPEDGSVSIQYTPFREHHINGSYIVEANSELSLAIESLRKINNFEVGVGVNWVSVFTPVIDGNITNQIYRLDYSMGGGAFFEFYIQVVTDNITGEVLRFLVQSNYPDDYSQAPYLNYNTPPRPNSIEREDLEDILAALNALDHTRRF